MGAPEVHVTVLTAPSDGMELTTENRLVRTAILYADRVTLVSPKGAMIAMLGGAASLPQEALEAVAQQALRRQVPSHHADLIDRLKRKKHKNRDEVAVLFQWREEVRRATEHIQSTAARSVVDAGGNDLAEAIAAGVLEVDTMGLEDGETSDGVVQRFIEALLEAVGTGSATYPMFDDESGGLLRALEQERGMPSAPGPEVGEGSLAGYLIGTLDSVGNAPMKDVLQARRALGRPLIDFRSAIADLATTMGETPWAEGFRGEAAGVYRRDVAPALAELEDQARRLAVFEDFKRGVSSLAVTGMAMGTVALVFTAVQAVPEMAGAAGVVGGALTFATVLGEVYRARMDLEAQRDRNKMVFLYQADRRLAK